MKNKLNFIYKLEGEKVADGIDIFELTPILLSLGELIQESNEIINPNSQKKIAVNVKPFEKGSFIVDIVLFAQNNLSQLIDMVNTDNIKEIKELLDWLGIVKACSGVALGGTSLFGLYKFLMGKPKTVEQLNANEYRVTNGEDKSITVNKKVFSLFQNQKITNNIYNIYGKPFENGGIDTVKSYIKDQEEETIEVVNKDEGKFFIPNNWELINPNEETKENTRTMYLNPKRGSFEGEGNSWSFRKGTNREDIIKATIRDETFLNKLKSGEIRPFSNDLIEVEIIEKQKVVNQEVQTTYEITRVIDYKPAPIQQTFFEN